MIQDALGDVFFQEAQQLPGVWKYFTVSAAHV